MAEIRPNIVAKIIGIRYWLDIFPKVVIIYPERSVAPMEPREAAVLMREVITPLFLRGITFPIREDHAGATIEALDMEPLERGTSPRAPPTMER
jgi:hypothetical protein